MNLKKGENLRKINPCKDQLHWCSGFFGAGNNMSYLYSSKEPCIIYITMCKRHPMEVHHIYKWNTNKNCSFTIYAFWNWIHKYNHIMKVINVSNRFVLLHIIPYLLEMTQLVLSGWIIFTWVYSSLYRIGFVKGKNLQRRSEDWTCCDNEIMLTIIHALSVS